MADTITSIASFQWVIRTLAAISSVMSWIRHWAGLLTSAAVTSIDFIGIIFSNGVALKVFVYTGWWLERTFRRCDFHTIQLAVLDS